MKATLHNTDFSWQQWQAFGTREQLRALARKHGITRGRDAIDTAVFLSLGMPSPFHHHGDAKKLGAKFIQFPITLEIS